MTTLRGTAGHAPAPALHRPAVGARESRLGGRTASLRRIAGSRHGRELLAFAVIGVVSTGAYGVLYLLLRTATGPTTANALALVVTAVGNTAANRRLTFGRRGGSMLRDQIAGLVALGIALAITTASVSLLGALAPNAGRPVELAVLVVANAQATVARFVLLRSWIAADRHRAVAPAPISTDRQE
ncbi:MAG TPA: GtrA family protein [Candidatus Limnocylindrales bacterium]